MKRLKRVRWTVQDIKEWIVSYLVILIIPIVICSVFFLYTYFVIWEETRDSNTAAMQLIASELDTIFEEAKLLEYSIQNNRTVKETAKISMPLNADKRFLLSKAGKEVTSYIGSKKWINSWYVFLTESEMCLIPSEGYLGAYVTFDELYKRFGQNCGLSKEDWKVILKQQNKREILYNSNSRTFSYITSLPIRSSLVTMNIIFEFNSDYVQKTLSHLDYMKNSGIILTDGDNRVLTSRNMGDIDIEMLSEQIHADAGYQTAFINKEKVMVSCVESKHIGLKMFSIIPYEEFWKKAYESLSSFLLALFLCILSGTGVAYFFSIGKQQTWGKFKRIVSRKLENNTESLRFRNKEVATAIENIVQEYDTMQKQLTSVDSMKKELLLTATLKGRIRTEEVERVFEKNGVPFEIGNYVVILFNLSRFDNFYDVGVQDSSMKDLVKIKQAVLSVIQTLTEKEFDCEILNLEEKIVCIVDFGSLDKEECYDQVAELAEKAMINAFEKLNVFQAISISDVHKHVFSLQNAYSEASRTMEYQMSGEEPLIMNYMEMVKKTQMSYLYSLENETALIHWIYAGKKDAALQLFEEIYEKNVINVNGSEDLRRCLMWNLTASVLRAENELADKTTLPDMQNLLENIRSKITLHEAKEILVQRISQICDEVARVKGKKGDILAGQLKEYIEEHFEDPNLNNREIAEYFHMNISYLSTFFKEKTGMSPLTYIHKVRLENAKELLLNTELTLEEISAKVGCNNCVTLNRLFKKSEGITPAVYKKKYRK